MKKFAIYCAVSLFAAVAARADTMAQAAPATPAVPALAQQGTVLRDRCNIRSRPTTTAEVVAQVSRGDVLNVLERKSATDGGKPMDWLRVTLPATAKCYVSAKLVTDGVVNAASVYVRCGAGTSFKDVGKLAKGDKVEVVEAKGEWLQIKPTAQCTGWISAELVDALPALPPPAPPAPAQTGRIEAVTPPLAVVTPPPAVPQVRVLDVGPDVQVRYVVKTGTLRGVADAANKPGSYELMTPEVERRSYRIAYLETAQMNLARYEGKNVRVFGNERWRSGERDPVIVVERVEPVL
jgi:uncharacterized protein YgiM (DUF1202 family)